MVAYSFDVSTTESQRTVPSGAVTTALAIVESLDGRVVGGLSLDSVAEISTAVDRWGRETITDAFGLLIYTVMNVAKPAPGTDDLLHLVVPAVLTRFHRMQMPEVPDEALPTVAGLLTAAFFDQDPYEWRTSLGPIPADEALVWCYTTWLLIDFMDNAAFGEQPGRFAEILTQVLASDPHDRTDADDDTDDHDRND